MIATLWKKSNYLIIKFLNVIFIHLKYMYNFNHSWLKISYRGCCNNVLIFDPLIPNCWIFWMWYYVTIYLEVLIIGHLQNYYTSDQLIHSPVVLSQEAIYKMFDFIFPFLIHTVIYHITCNCPSLTCNLCRKCGNFYVHC